MKLIIQIPCYNEAQTLETALNALPRQIDGIDTIEYLIINDGSEDETVKTALKWGVHYVVNFRTNRGLAKGFMAGLDACLRNGADIIVNTDADNQYEGADIAKLIRPILEGKSDIVIGERPIDEMEDFSLVKKKLQHFGSFIVRKASQTDIPDAPSGFRAYSREAAMRLNVTNEYTYTLETIVQAGRTKMAMTSVPVRTNKEIRPSRLMKSMMGYVRKSVLTIGHVFMMYKPLQFFTAIGSVIFLCGAAVGVRFLLFYFRGAGSGHIQSLILAAVLLLLGFQTVITGLLADVIASSRKLLEDVQYHVRRMDYDGVKLPEAAPDKKRSENRPGRKDREKDREENSAPQKIKPDKKEAKTGTERNKKGLETETERNKKGLETGTERNKKVLETGTERNKKVLETETERNKKDLETGTERNKKDLETEKTEWKKKGSENRNRTKKIREREQGQTKNPKTETGPDKKQNPESDKKEKLEKEKLESDKKQKPKRNKKEKLESDKKQKLESDKKEKPESDKKQKPQPNKKEKLESDKKQKPEPDKKQSRQKQNQM